MRVLLHRHSAVRLAAATSVMALAVAGLTASNSAASPDQRAGFSKAASQPTLLSSTSGDKAPSSLLAKTPPGLKHLTSAKQIAVMIKYDYDAVASYRGTVVGYAATSPSVTKRSLSSSTAATTRYLSYVKAREAGITSRLRAAVPSTLVTQRYRTVYGGVAALVPGNRISQILRMPGVVAVQRDSVKHPLTDSSAKFINATAAYTKLHTTANAGQGIVLGNLDTGVWPEHPSFADQGNLPAYSGPALPCNFGDNPLTPANDPFVCGNKLVGGRAFLNTYQAVNGPPTYSGTARDAEGHGSHTASTSAGNIVNNVQTIGPVIARINGIAPGAQIMEYRVCGGPAGCYSSDTTAAVGQAILDGVDVINFSISGGSDPLTDPTELAFLDAYNANVFVAASAGNSGPGAGTANHAGPWVTTVGASTQTREFASQLTLTSTDTATFTTEGASLTAGAGPAPVVLASAAPYSDALCTHAAPAGSFAGKIVVCARGSNARVDKGFNVLQGGAAGMILYNPTLADVETDNHWLPAVHVADGTSMLAFLAAHPGITGQFTAGAAKNGQGDVMAAFSSRGPLGSFVKPDITAPGVQILAAMTPTPETITDGPPGQYYQAIAGTSMSSPHIAGAAILIRAVHPNWTPGQIKSAMMTQSITTVVKEDGTTPADPFDMGAGRINVGRANKAPITISDSGANMVGLVADPVHAIDLNIPSINAPTMPGRVTTTRTLQNVSGGSLAVTASAVVKAKTKITFSPRTFTIPAGGSRAVQITITSTAPIGAQQFASVRFGTAKGTAHLPVAFIRQQGVVSLTQTCASPTVQRLHTTTCDVSATNTGFGDQTVDLTSSTDDNLTLVGTTGGTLAGGVVTASGTVAGATLGVPSVDPGDTPGGGYLDLVNFGISPIALGDEDVINFNVPSYSYNGASYSLMGIDSNGYLIAGGGSSADNNCCNLPSGPSPNAPNDIMAPFWTDLDGTGANGLRIATLTDGVDTWIVAQWEVNVFGTNDLRKFQIWVGINGDANPAQDISYGYDAIPSDPSGQPFLVGAENAAGAGDVEAVLPTTSLVVTSTDPTPGASLTYQLTVRGQKNGAGNLHTEMNSTGVPGTTVVDTPLQVTP